MTQALAWILAATIAASGAALWWMDGKLEAANRRAESMKEDLGKEEQSRKGFEAAATNCGKSVLALQAAAKSLVDGYQKRLKASQGLTTKAEALVAELLSKERPAGLDECQATFLELDQEIDRRHTQDETESTIDDRHPRT